VLRQDASSAEVPFPAFVGLSSRLLSPMIKGSNYINDRGFPYELRTKQPQIQPSMPNEYVGGCS
jgi:hypothetical protein